ncbi:uncharacterized protein LOC134557842 isoform X1 [Prinia subflava]|uniref:uncharacterized protein LOC134557842 isoform X1 n=1 Tax=Prinia subflava TaxID=208062 RepID=UPI002FE11E22
MAPGSPAGSAPGSPRLNGPSWVASPAGHRPGSAAGPTRLPLDRAFPRSAWCAVKIARTLVALAAFIRFLTAGEHEFYTGYAGLETVTTVFFLLLYLLRLDARMRCLYWPLAVSTRGLRVPGCSGCEYRCPLAVSIDELGPHSGPDRSTPQMTCTLASTNYQDVLPGYVFPGGGIWLLDVGVPSLFSSPSISKLMSSFPLQEP